MKFKSIEFKNDELFLLDQRLLPENEEYYVCRTYMDVEYAIREMVVRGAPAIGSVAAYGIAFAAADNPTEDEFISRCNFIMQSRPTAVNLFWAVKRMMDVVELSKQIDYSELLLHAKLIYDEDIATNKRMAEIGNEIVKENATILTHCNTGALATVAYGTALGVIREAHYSGKNIHVYADETRPRLQGARLTAWELVKEGIPSTLIADNVAATLIRDNKIDLILVGADRIALNGDTANKIGTFMLSALAKVYNIPFYIVAPMTTIDFDIEKGEKIEIEERSADEVRMVGNSRVAPLEINVFNPAFDVTPNENITGIITEKGIVYPPFKENILKIKE
ncbi:MAG: S-methyl-5-thioribose-1-phosphate isomerase [Clostridiales bacterium]|nr:S-methyl-5-thioribose-1-phosphate isomerase [Clostridiales bacterium]